jgi:hypothetical protein
MMLSASLILASLALGCGDDVSGPRSHDSVATEDFHYSFEVSEHILVSVAGVNGDINVMGLADTDSIVISGTRRVTSDDPVDAAEHLDLLTVEVENEAGVVSAVTHQPEHSDGRIYEVDYRVYIPEDLAVTITDVNGTIYIRSVAEPVTVSHVNGAVNLDGISASVMCSVVNGTIEGDVTLPLDGVIGMEVVNGEVDIEIPAATSAMFLAGVVNGSISVTGLVLEDMVSSATSLSGRLGEGRGTIGLAVVNGTIAARGF